MRAFAMALLVWGGLSLVTGQAWAGGHSVATYRALEKLPEVAESPAVVVESLEAFLAVEEKTIEALLASQEAWAMAHLDNYPPRPPALAFVADPQRSDEARKRAFLMALRVAPNARFALYIQPDPWADSFGTALPLNAVSSGPDGAGTATNTPLNTPLNTRYLALKEGDWIAPLTVVASATDEPCLGLDLFLWEDSPSEWGKIYGFGQIPFGNARQAEASQTPMHVGYLRESGLVYLALPALRYNLLQLRLYQFSTLAELAFRTGHSYWGWRFAGLALHYVQDMTQPFRASLIADDTTFPLLSTSLLASVGLRAPQQDYFTQLANRIAAIEHYEADQLTRGNPAHPDSVFEQALHNTEQDHTYPKWNDRYVCDVVSPQAVQLGPRLRAAMPTGLSPPPTGAPSDAFDRALAEVLTNFGAHSRNAIRAILRAGYPM